MNREVNITSILDTDLYKLTMQQAVLKLYPEAETRYLFINRGKTEFPVGFGKALAQAVRRMEDLRLRDEEKEFLASKCPYLSGEYLEYLSNYRFDSKEVVIKEGTEGLKVVVEGPWHRTILWEVPLMAIISELYFKLTGKEAEAFPRAERQQRNLDKARLMEENEVKFADFGTRRRFSFSNHQDVVTDMKTAGETFGGTSNLLLAMELDITPIGTQAHEWTQFHGAVSGYKRANTESLNSWREVYGNDLSIALPDTYGSDVFFKSFDLEAANAFRGVRQDSGEPLDFLEKALAHYQSLGIDPSTKAIIFSDSLTPEIAVEIHEKCSGRMLDSYGIGTNLTNDVGVKPLNIVIKLVACRINGKAAWTSAVKLSDVLGKHTGDPEAIRKCKEELELI